MTRSIDEREKTVSVCQGKLLCRCPKMEVTTMQGLQSCCVIRVAIGAVTRQLVQALHLDWAWLVKFQISTPFYYYKSTITILIDCSTQSKRDMALPHGHTSGQGGDKRHFISDKRTLSSFTPWEKEPSSIPGHLCLSPSMNLRWG